MNGPDCVCLLRPAHLLTASLKLAGHTHSPSQKQGQLVSDAKMQVVVSLSNIATLHEGDSGTATPSCMPAYPDVQTAGIAETRYPAALLSQPSEAKTPNSKHVARYCLSDSIVNTQAIDFRRTCWRVGRCQRRCGGGSERTCRPVKVFQARVNDARPPEPRNSSSFGCAG